METAIATPARHVVSVVPEVQGDYGRNRYAFAAYNPDNTPAFNSRLWAAGPEAAEREVRRFVQSLIDADLLSPDWADFDIDLRPAPWTRPARPAKPDYYPYHPVAHGNHWRVYRFDDDRRVGASYVGLLADRGRSGYYQVTRWCDMLNAGRCTPDDLLHEVSFHHVSSRSYSLKLK